MFERGTLRVGAYRGASLFFHWSLALGLLAFGGIKFVPGFWLGFTLLVVTHEAGHAFLVRRMGFRVQSLVVHGFGGFCTWRGQASRLEHSVIAWGGVLAQAGLLLATLTYVALVGAPVGAFGQQLEQAWVSTNLWIMALNLLPIAPLDGAEAWQIFRAMRVESVSFGSIVRRCLPRLPRVSKQTKPKRKSPAGSSLKQPPRHEPPKQNGKPSADAQTAIAEALEKIAREAREARRKK